MGKINIYTILQGIGVFLLFIPLFYGCIYVSKGNIPISAILSIVTLIILASLVAGMINSKDGEKNTGFTFKEGLFSILYLAVAVVSFFVVFHFINVEYYLKEEIKETGSNILTEIGNITFDYEKQVAVSADKIEEGIDNAIRTFGNDKDVSTLSDSLSSYGLKVDYSDKSEIISDANRKKTSKKEADLKRALEGLEARKDNNRDFIAEKEVALDDWNRFKLHETFREMDLTLEQNLTALQKQFEAPSVNESWNRYSFQYTIENKADEIISNPWILIGKYKPSFILPIIVALIIHIFILLPYFVSKRSGKRRFYERNQADRGIPI